MSPDDQILLILGLVSAFIFVWAALGWSLPKNATTGKKIASVPPSIALCILIGIFARADCNTNIVVITPVELTILIVCDVVGGIWLIVLTIIKAKTTNDEGGPNILLVLLLLLVDVIVCVFFKIRIACSWIKRKKQNP